MEIDGITTREVSYDVKSVFLYQFMSVSSVTCPNPQSTSFILVLASLNHVNNKSIDSVCTTNIFFCGNQSENTPVDTWNNSQYLK